VAPASFTWKDGERTIHFGRNALEAALPALGEGYTLLSTERALAMAPLLGELAGDAFEIPPGGVDELAAELVGHVGPTTRIVALGGGHVIDTAKALAAARAPGRRPRVAAVPTTLGAGEMTAVHPRAAGADTSLPGVRPMLVINDPALSASEPDAQLAASASNALALAAECPATVNTSPLTTLACREAARLIALAYSDVDAPDRETLALAALLSGYAIDSAGYGLHHVLSQTLVRFAGVGRGPANAVMLPHTLVALERRGAPGAREIVALATTLAQRAGAVSLHELGVDEAMLDACADAAVQRTELDAIPPRAERAELRALYAAAS